MNSTKLVLGTLQSGTQLTWSGIPNNHFYSTGRSGEGKTYFSRSMAIQIPGLGGRCIIFDYTGDFVKDSPEQNWPTAGTEIINIRKDKIDLNPFLSEMEGETNDEISERVVALLSRGLRFTPTQWAYLSDAITEGLECDLLHSVADLVEMIKMDAEENDTAKRLLPKIKVLGKLLPSNGKKIDWKLDTPGITIIDMSSIKDPMALAVLAELLLWTICSLRMHSIPDRPTPLVLLLDECQRLRFQEGDTTVRILREGRKYGIWGWFSTQWISNKTAVAALNQAGLRIHFRPDDQNLHNTAREIACGDRKMVPIYESRLANLKRGQFMYRKGTSMITSRAPQS